MKKLLIVLGTVLVWLITVIGVDWHINHPTTTPPKPFAFPKEAMQIEFIPMDKPVEHKTKRVVIFASFFPDGKIPDYVVYYLKELKKVSDAIIFFADNPVFKEELSKIEDLVVYARFERHMEYDFGSYKRGYLYARGKGLLDTADEVVLANDSCYGPVYPFTEVFKKMEAQPVDFWGLSSNNRFGYDYHLQSFFLVFRKPVLADLGSFLQGVQRKKSVAEIIRSYEETLTQTLHKKGFKSHSFLPDDIKQFEPDYPKMGSADKTFFPATIVRDYGFPLIKIKLYTRCRRYFEREHPIELLNFIKEKNPALYDVIIPDLDKKGALKKERVPVPQSPAMME